MESLGFKETIVKSSEARRLGDGTYLGFCCWRGRTAKEVGRWKLARETTLLGRWLSDGLTSWGKVETHLDQVDPF
jgi:hypothetical protein